MANITNHYPTYQGPTEEKTREVLLRITGQTGFICERLLFTSYLYEKEKIGSQIYYGTHSGKSAVLKIQFLNPDIDEVEIMMRFKEQNKSNLIRLPEVYTGRQWNEADGYGYITQEYIDAPHIFEMPFATHQQMSLYSLFYQNYRAQALTRPWILPTEIEGNTLAFVLDRIQKWRKISQQKGRLTKDAYKAYFDRFEELAKKHLKDIEMVFCHGHLTARDIYALPDGTFVLMSNLFWSYRPEWYDLAFNIWSCLLHIRDTNYTFEQLIEYVNKWLDVYRQIPIVQEDKDFDQKITILLLERTMGAILMDLGVGDFYGEEKNKVYFEHLLKLHQQFFDYLTAKL